MRTFLIILVGLAACSYDTDALRGTLFAKDAGDDAGADAQSVTDTTLPDASVRDTGGTGNGGTGGIVGTGGAPGTGGMQPTCIPVAEICNGKDDDCDGLSDDGIGCTLNGAACAQPRECVSSVCANGRCCEKACGSCETCSAEGKCVALPDGAGCEPGGSGLAATCDGKTQWQGDACLLRRFVCKSGFCALTEEKDCCKPYCDPVAVYVGDVGWIGGISYSGGKCLRSQDTFLCSGAAPLNCSNSGRLCRAETGMCM